MSLVACLIFAGCSDDEPDHVKLISSLLPCSWKEKESWQWEFTTAKSSCLAINNT